VQVITPISYEHTDKFGSTLAKIASQKAGIIKNNATIVISSPQEKEALRIIQSKCQAVGAKLCVVGKDIKIPSFKINLIGRHQLANATAASIAVKALSNYGFKISPKAVREGIKNTRWPGRCEVLQKHPLIILDGAQNLASALVLKAAIKEKFKYKKLILVLGICADKDIPGICGTLDSLADQVILTKAQTPRAADPKKLAVYFKRKIYATQSVKEAGFLAQKLAHKEDLVLVTGSLFVVGELRKCLKKI
jgi:dihydrofolate synthase / folylpolyglutamate synthase